MTIEDGGKEKRKIQNDYHSGPVCVSVREIEQEWEKERGKELSKHFETFTSLVTDLLYRLW